MERDFLGAIGRDQEESEMKEGETGSKAESDYLGAAPATQRQYQAKAGVTPPFMSFRPAREDSRDSFSGFRQHPAVVTAGDGIKRHSPPWVPHHQSQFGFDGHVSSQQQYAAVAHAHGIESYDVAARHGSRPFYQPMQFNPGNPMLRVQSLPSVAGGVPFNNQYFMMGSPVPSSTVGVYGPRDLRNPESTRMTIFYNGAVNVFDVPLEKAQELMVLANRASIPSPPSAVQKSNSLVNADTRFAAPEVSPARKILVQKPETFVPHESGISSAIPVVLQDVTLSKSTSSSNNESAGPTTLGVSSVVPPVSQASSAEPVQQAISAAAAAAVTPRAVPQARKASLARFLEKRKERVTSVVPYPSSKSPLESSDTLGSTSTPSKSSGTDIAPLINNNCQESMSLGLSRNISFSSEKVPQHKFTDLKADQLSILHIDTTDSGRRMGI